VNRSDDDSTFGFVLDRFQRDACAVIDEGRSVIVAAPTGSGKTVVALHAVERALARGRRAFYTAPVKALSNQKFLELRERLGPGRVGILTGDVSIRADADVVVMTTEVLRNMIYAQSPQLHDLDVVVLDEVHFLQDAYRGPVWEEVIIHLPARIPLVCLSATVSNAGELADWISGVRGAATAIVETRRPVDLETSYLLHDRTGDALVSFPVLVNGHPNPQGRRWEETRRSAGGQRRRVSTPGRVEVVEHLRDRGLLPSLYFIFSRQQCDEAARSVFTAGLRFDSGDDRLRTREIVERRLSGVDSADLDSLDAAAFVERLESGIASHHAGLVPAFKEMVEECFAAGLVKVVFATETLAVGVNMPARSVVIEKLTKFTGERHERVSPSSFTQLTGRAGRRGLDVHGDALVLWSPFVRFDEVAALAASRSFRLVSAFRPTYNMAANLVATHDAETARRLLDLSFAQYQEDLKTARRHRPVDAVLASLEVLRPGDVVDIGPILGSAGEHRAVVLTCAHRSEGLRVGVVDTEGTTHRLVAADVRQPLVTLGAMELPHPFAPHRRDFTTEVVRMLRRAQLHPRRNRKTGPAEVPVVEGPPRRLGPTVADRFDVLLALLEERGHVRNWRLTDTGKVLRRIFHESDLLVAEAVVAGLLDDTRPEVAAGLVSVFVYEHRSPEPAPPAWFPDRGVEQRFRSIADLSNVIRAAEAMADIAPHRPPDASFFAVAHAWAAGEDLATILEDEEVSGGDFVRTMRQLIDLLQQLALAAPRADSRGVFAEAARRLRRGIVAVTDLVVDEHLPGGGVGET
jgi:ATP-dependent RNA helicase HelY